MKFKFQAGQTIISRNTKRWCIEAVHMHNVEDRLFSGSDLVGGYIIYSLEPDEWLQMTSISADICEKEFRLEEVDADC